MKIPYRCSMCAAENCKLWRQSNVILSHCALLCATCAAKDQDKKIHNLLEALGEYDGDSIGELIPAVPTEDGETFYNYMSVPLERVNWWWALPPEKRAPIPFPPGPGADELYKVECDKDIARWIKETIYLVEASSFESTVLWERWAKSAEEMFSADYKDSRRKRVVWEQLNPGTLPTVGMVDNRPVVIIIDFVRINGNVIAFYEATSQVVDYRAVEDYLKKRFSHLVERGGCYMTNAMNFSSAIDACNRRVR